jgi:hypothetical protein
MLSNTTNIYNPDDLGFQKGLANLARLALTHVVIGQRRAPDECSRTKSRGT